MSDYTQLSLEKDLELRKVCDQIDNTHNVEALQTMLKDLYRLMLSKDTMFKNMIKAHPGDFQKDSAKNIRRE